MKKLFLALVLTMSATAFISAQTWNPEVLKFFKNGTQIDDTTRLVCVSGAFFYLTRDSVLFADLGDDDINLVIHLKKGKSYEKNKLGNTLFNQMTASEQQKTLEQLEKMF